MNKRYGEKEKLILQTALELIKSRRDLRSLRASDIAEAAGVGKGTLYNYFSSKDDILVQAIVYYATETFAGIEAGLNSSAGLEGKLTFLLEKAWESYTSAPWMMILLSMDSQYLTGFLENFGQLREEFENRFMRIIELFAQTAQEEGYHADLCLVGFLIAGAFRALPMASMLEAPKAKAIAMGRGMVMNSLKRKVGE